MGGQRHPLLGHDQEDALWDRVEAASGSGVDADTLTVHQLFNEHGPSEALHLLATGGVRKLGTMTLAVSCEKRKW